MKKINIVRDSSDFDRIIGERRFVKDQNLIIYYSKSEYKNNRFGITVPKKLGKAHIRNYYKRVLRNICDNSNLIYSNVLDYIIIVRKGCLETNFESIMNSYKYLMSKIEKEKL